MDYGTCFPMDHALVAPLLTLPATAARLGADVHMVSGVGEDERGEALLQVYRKHGVNIDLVQVLKDYPTGVVHVELTEKGLPTFTIGENAAWDHWEWNEEIDRMVTKADALYFGTLGQRGQSCPCRNS